jgi:hypothetical protein
MLSLITLPEDFVSSSLAYVGNLFTDLSPLLIVVIGLPIAFWVIKSVLGVVRFRTSRRG